MSVSCGDIRSQLVALGLLGGGIAVADSQSLRDALVLDSLRLIDFVASLEGRFGIRVDEYDLLPENFESIRAIAGYVNQRLGMNGGAGRHEQQG
jgi:acyl carrier protein